MKFVRKWIIQRLPNFTYQKHYYTELSYLSLNPEITLEKNTYLLHANSLYETTLNIKIGNAEYKLAVSLDEYADIKENFIFSNPIEKDVYIYEFDGHEINASVIDDKFIYVEVEFDDEIDAHIFSFPWEKYVKPLELTKDNGFNMANYWQDRYSPFTKN